MDADEDRTIRLPDVLGLELVRPLEREIVTLKLAPGVKLVEEEICRRYGVSRSPVREALRALEGFGLVERRPRRGMFVAPISLERLDEVYACRIPLEGIAAQGVARRATPALVAQLTDAVDRMAAAEAGGRREDGFAANVVLTDLLHEHCGNETLARLLQTLDKQALRFRYYCYRESDDMIGSDIRSNHALVAAIARRDPGEARAITERLVTDSWALVRAALAARTRQAAAT